MRKLAKQIALFWSHDDTVCFHPVLGLDQINSVQRIFVCEMSFSILKLGSDFKSDQTPVSFCILWSLLEPAYSERSYCKRSEDIRLPSQLRPGGRTGHITASKYDNRPAVRDKEIAWRTTCNWYVEKRPFNMARKVIFYPFHTSSGSWIFSFCILHRTYLGLMKIVSLEENR